MTQAANVVLMQKMLSNNKNVLSHTRSASIKNSEVNMEVFFFCFVFQLLSLLQEKKKKKWQMTI